MYKHKKLSNYSISFSIFLKRKFILIICKKLHLWISFQPTSLLNKGFFFYLKNTRKLRVYSCGRFESCKSNPNMLVCSMEISGRSPLSTSSGGSQRIHPDKLSWFIGKISWMNLFKYIIFHINGKQLLLWQIFLIFTVINYNLVQLFTLFIDFFSMGLCSYLCG